MNLNDQLRQDIALYCQAEGCTQLNAIRDILTELRHIHEEQVKGVISDTLDFDAEFASHIDASYELWQQERQEAREKRENEHK